ncbi:hypothetical protein WMF04_07810 [Sorangium sp. So ce260]|uniref:hypothetical protein n=1 Tax=Sorangium sp. So ce260 TaxID=3133291 RepID=UPI003F63D3EC
MTPPSGFTLAHDQPSSTSDGPVHAMVYTKVVGSSEPAEYTFDVPAGVPGPSHHDARGPTLSVCCATLTYAPQGKLLNSRLRDF